jgi:hypothetical protein
MLPSQIGADTLNIAFSYLARISDRIASTNFSSSDTRLLREVGYLAFHKINLRPGFLRIKINKY